MSNERVYKETTAYWKIDLLLRNNKKSFVIQGGQGAGKTISILMLLIRTASLRPKTEISIVSKELSKMKKGVVRDFKKILQDWGMYNKNGWNGQEAIYRFTNQSYIEFIGLDQADVGKGLRRDIVFGNEANKFGLIEWDEMTSRAKTKIIDFNPNEKFWGHDIVEKGNFLNLTYLDNEYLSKEEVANILEYKSKGFIAPDLLDYDKPENIKNNFYANKWRVYGLGQVAVLDNIVFSGWQKISFQEFLNVKSVNTIYAVDWGVNDPFAISQLKVYDNKLYVHELHYKSENQVIQGLSNEMLLKLKQSSDGVVNYVMNNIGVPKSAIIVCDNARPQSILNLRANGWEYAHSTENKDILTRVTALQGLEVFYTETSVNLENEINNYTYFTDRLGIVKDKFIDSFNHLLDGIGYGWEYYFRAGVLK